MSKHLAEALTEATAKEFYRSNFKEKMMFKIILNLKNFIAALLVCLAFAYQEANAVSFNFVDLAAGNEHGAISESFTSGSLTVTATAYALTTGATYNMYLDDLSAGHEGGMGVCQVLGGGGECSPSSDDNITANEVLVLAFSEPVALEELTFNNGNHLDDYLGFFGLAIDSTPLSAGDFTLYSAVPVYTGSLYGTIFSFIADASISGLDSIEREIYLSSISATPVPEPTTMVLLASGLLPLVRRRYRTKA